MQDDDEATNVSCRACHRLERWAQGERRVLTPGGSRRPDKPELMAWDVVEACVAGEGRIVGECSGCAQPLVADASSDIEAFPWRFATHDGTLVFDGVRGLSTSQGPLTRAEAHDRVRAANPSVPWWRTIDLGRSAFRATVLTLMLGPVLAFGLALLSLSMFMGPALRQWREFLGGVAQVMGLR